MKASELRIGNLVKINNALLPETHGKTYSVYKLQKTFDFDFPSSAGIVSLTDKVNMYTQFDQFIEPIPLTEEWLVRFGFEKRDIPSLGMIRYFIWIDKIRRPKNVKFEQFAVDLISLRYIFSNPQIKIKHVHQLQNLYFALTGEELTIK